MRTVTTIMGQDTPDIIEKMIKQHTDKLIAEHKHCYGKLTGVNVSVNYVNHAYEYRCTIYIGENVCEHLATFS